MAGQLRYATGQKGTPLDNVPVVFDDDTAFQFLDRWRDMSRSRVERCVELPKSQFVSSFMNEDALFPLPIKEGAPVPAKKPKRPAKPRRRKSAGA
jgi:hypothetical protein